MSDVPSWPELSPDNRNRVIDKVRLKLYCKMQEIGPSMCFTDGGAGILTEFVIAVYHRALRDLAEEIEHCTCVREGIPIPEGWLCGKPDCPKTKRANTALRNISELIKREAK